MVPFGEPTKLRDDVLPTKKDIFNHFLYLKSVKEASGDWKQNTDVTVKVKPVWIDVCEIWNRTGYPHCLESREGERKVLNFILQGKKLNKVAMNRRGDNYWKDMEVLFDFSLCQHPDNCDC